MSFFKHFLLFFSILLVLTLVDFFYLGQPLTGIDDANIFMQYARNLAHGHGFVFHPGGEKVEGFTSLLWVVVCSIFYLVSAHPELLITAFLLLITSLTVTMVYLELRKDIELLETGIFLRYFLFAFSAFLVCIGPSFVVWSVLSGMENGLWNFLFLGSVIFLLRYYRKGFLHRTEKAGLVTFGCLMLLTRPEGLAWGLVFIVLLFVAAKRYRNNYLFPFVYLAVLGTTVILLTFFRIRYFGYPLPNTYYAKVSHDRIYNLKEGLSYLTGFLTNFNALITLFFSVLIAGSWMGIKNFSLFRDSQEAAHSKNRFRLRVIIVTLVIGIGLFLPLLTGGDHFGGYRFYQSLLLLFAWGFPTLLYIYRTVPQERTGRKILTLATFILLPLILVGIGDLYNLKNIPQTRMNFEFALAAEGRNTADGLNGFWEKEKPSVGVVAVGGFALNYQGETIDLMGLNNIIMGHSPGNRVGVKNHAAFNKDIFYQLDADLLMPKLVADESAARNRYTELRSTDNFDNKAMKNIFNDSLFHQHYQPVMISRSGKNVFAFSNKRQLEKMKIEGVEVKDLGGEWSIGNGPIGNSQ